MAEDANGAANGAGPDPLAEYEQRAADAEARLADIEAQLERLALGGGETPAADGGATTGVLAELHALRELLVRAKVEKQAAAAELAAKTLEAEKLKYQVLHLTRAVREADAKLVAATAAKA